MVLGFLAVEEIGLINAEITGQGAGCCRYQGNALIGRAEHGVEIVAAGFLDQCSIKVAQLGDLAAGAVVAGVDKIGGVTAALGHKLAEAEHVGAHHKLDKFFFRRCQHERIPHFFRLLGRF